MGVLFCSVVTSGTGLPARRDETPAKRWVVGGEFGEEGISVEVEVGLVVCDYDVVAGGLAVLWGVLGDDGLAFLGFWAGGF